MNTRRILILLSCLGLCAFMMGAGQCKGQIPYGEEGQIDVGEIGAAVPTPTPEAEPEPEAGPVPEPEPKPEAETLKDSYCKEPPPEAKPEVVTPRRECLPCTRYLPPDAEAVASFQWRDLYGSKVFQESLGDQANELLENFAKLEIDEAIPLGGVGLHQLDVMCVACFVRRWPEAGAMKDVASSTNQTSYGGTDVGQTTAESFSPDQEREGGGGGPFDMCQQFVFVLESTNYPEDFSLVDYVNERLPDALAQGRLEYDEVRNAFKQHNVRFNQDMYIGFMDGRLVLGTVNYFDHFREMADLPKPLPDDACPFKDLLSLFPNDTDVKLAGNRTVIDKLFEDDEEEEMSGEGKDRQEVEFEDLFVIGALDRFVAGLDLSGEDLWIAVNVRDKAGRKTGDALLSVNALSLVYDKVSQLFRDEDKAMPPEPLGSEDMPESLGTWGEPPEPM